VLHPFPPLVKEAVPPQWPLVNAARASSVSASVTSVLILAMTRKDTADGLCGRRMDEAYASHVCLHFGQMPRL
jgi:hypothetical protein